MCRSDRPSVLTMEIGGYRTEGLLGEGAGGAVWRAVAPDGTPVALKVLGGPYEKALQAAKREAALVAQVNHPHLARIRALVCDADQVALAIELADGGSLADLLGVRGRLTPAETLTVLIPVASALATAHERGVVHGDLSPANIVFDGSGRPLLTDLGAARVAVECGLPVSATPGYVAPEVARGGVPDPSADVFTLAAVGLHCLSGRAAWNADDLRDVVVHATVGQWPDPDNADGPPGLVAAIRAALGDVPGRRPGAASLAVELSRSGKPEPIDLGDRPIDQSGDAPQDAAGRHRSAGEPAPPPRTDRAFSGAHRSGDVGSVAQQRVRRVATRVRASSAPAPPEQQVRRRWPRRLPGSGHRIGPVSAPDPLSDRRTALRIAVTAAVLLVIGVLAVQAGLMWAGSGSKRGSALPPVAAGSARPNRSATPVAPSPSPSTAAASASSAPTTHASGSGSGADQQAPQWLLVVRDLDSARAAALVQRDAARLSAVYTDDSAAKAVDAATISRLSAQGFRVSGALHRISGVRVVRTIPGDRIGEVRLEVTDSLPSYRVIDRSGSIVGSTGVRGPARRMIEVVRTADGYRISAVSTR